MLKNTVGTTNKWTTSLSWLPDLVLTDISVRCFVVTHFFSLGVIDHQRLLGLSFLSKNWDNDLEVLDSQQCLFDINAYVCYFRIVYMILIAGSISPLSWTHHHNPFLMITVLSLHVLCVWQERKLLATAKQMLQDSKTKIEIIRMHIVKVSQSAGGMDDTVDPAGRVC